MHKELFRQFGDVLTVNRLVFDEAPPKGPAVPAITPEQALELRVKAGDQKAIKEMAAAREAADREAQAAGKKGKGWVAGLKEVLGLKPTALDGFKEKYEGAKTPEAKEDILRELALQVYNDAVDAYGKGRNWRPVFEKYGISGSVFMPNSHEDIVAYAINAVSGKTDARQYIRYAHDNFGGGTQVAAVEKGSGK